MNDERDEEAAASEAASGQEPTAPLGVAGYRAGAWSLCAAALGIVVVLWGLGRTAAPWTLEQLLLTRPVPASGVAGTAPASDRVDAALARDDVSEQLKLALVEELSRDPADSATDMLLRAARNPSLLISMAALKGLTGRRCDRLQPELAELMQDDEWQRRAWAVKVLGESGCTAVGSALNERWRAEPDARVREQIADAMSALRASSTQ
jgi:HEAT repeat protein